MAKPGCSRTAAPAQLGRRQDLGEIGPCGLKSRSFASALELALSSAANASGGEVFAFAAS